MGKVVRFTGRMEGVQSLRVEPHSEKGKLILDLRVLGPFTPNLFEDASATLSVVFPGHDQRVIRGGLKRMASITARGTHYRLVFTPHTPGTLDAVTFAGKNNFSNVLKVTIQPQRGRSYEARNRFYRIPEKPSSNGADCS
jgi:hypothetical protein